MNESHSGTSGAWAAISLTLVACSAYLYLSLATNITDHKKTEKLGTNMEKHKNMKKIKPFNWHVPP
jgi:hypothetical protein